MLVGGFGITEMGQDAGLLLWKQSTVFYSNGFKVVVGSGGVCFNIYSRFSLKDTEEFHSIVSVAEKLNEQVAHAADERLQSELQTLGSIHF